MQEQPIPNSPANASNDNEEKGPGVRFPPPLVFLLCLLLGIGLHYLLPLRLGISEPLNFLGFVFVAFAIAIIITSALAFRRAKTAIEPWKPTSNMVYGGCYKFSRNPIYLSFCLCLIGLGIAANSIWILLSCIPCGIVIYVIAIKKEEAYLEKKFGNDYLRYKQQVRRWL